MLHETLLQGQVFLCMLYFGLWCGILFELKNIIEKTFFNNKIICVILDTCFVAISSVIFVLGKNIVNFGEFRLFLLLSFCFGAILEHFSIGFLVEKLFNLIYTNVIKFFKLLICKIKSRLEKSKQLRQKKKEEKSKQKAQKNAQKQQEKQLKKEKTKSTRKTKKHSKKEKTKKPKRKEKSNEHKTLEHNKIYSH